MDSWMAISSGFLFSRIRPRPYRPSVFSRTTTKSISSGPLSLSGRVYTRIELDRTQIDVLIELKAQFEKNAFFKNAGLHIGMADGAEVNGIQPA